jgi:1-deoxy-D-xylulose-5-phosphate reductoisomerase
MSHPRRITILGATGSIGGSTIDLVTRNPDQFQVVALTAQSDVAGLAKAAIATGAERAIIGRDDLYADLKAALSGTGITAAAGPDSICDAARIPVDITMAAIVGCAGLAPTMAALEHGTAVALANKEALVAAGDMMLDRVTQTGATLLPTDSEHNAIFQCLDRSAPDGVRRIILTASGGPFRTWDADAIASATCEQALKHPNWSMGAKITVDSATLFNKGLELIEASYLFAMPSDRIDIIIHPQSVIHSMVEYRDGSVLAQMGAPDMRTPIAHCLAWPKRMETPVERLDFAKIARLDFEAPDPVKFPALRLARAALEAGAPAPGILNAANEVAVAAFLDRRIAFGAIAAIVEAVLGQYSPPVPACIDDIFTIDTHARRLAMAQVERMSA